MAVSVTSKGQVTIPKRVRDALGITPGSKVEFDVAGGGARLKLVKRHAVFTRRRGACHPRLQRSSDSGRQDARRAGDEEGGESVRAVDTNILARYYLRDDAVQGRVAAGVLSAGDVFVPKTVVLELEWVLRYVADQPERQGDRMLGTPHRVAGGNRRGSRRDRSSVRSLSQRNRLCRCAASCRQQSLQRAADVRRPRVCARAKKLRLKPPVRVPHG